MARILWHHILARNSSGISYRMLGNGWQQKMRRKHNAGKCNDNEFHRFTDWRRQMVCNTWIPCPQLFSGRNNANRQDPVKHQIESPFGLLNVTQQDGQVIYNHNTIVWGNITSKTSSSTTLFHGQAYLEVAHPDIDISTSRLVDTQRQVEISFHNIPDQYNVELSPAFSVVGMPKTFLLFPRNTTNALYKVYKNIIILCNDTQKAESQLCKDTLTFKFKWDRHHQLKRSIKNEIKFLSKEDEEYTEGILLYSISYAWGNYNS